MNTALCADATDTPFRAVLAHVLRIRTGSHFPWFRSSGRAERPRGEDAASFSYRNISMSRLSPDFIRHLLMRPVVLAPGSRESRLGRSGAGLGYSVRKCQPVWCSPGAGPGAGTRKGVLSEGQRSEVRHAPREGPLLPGTCGAPTAPKPWSRQDAAPTSGLCLAETPRALCTSVSGRRPSPCQAGPMHVCLLDVGCAARALLNPGSGPCLPLASGPGGSLGD